MSRDVITAGPAPGTVWLVGAGPGDPGLLTLRAAEALRSADVVLHDALVGPGILGLIPAGATRVNVGKRKGHHPWPQAAINARLVAEAQAGRRVVRLKGGDPFVFGRGGEEALALQAADIPFLVVPGITAGTAAPAVAGIPVTHRGLSAAVTFLTGHAGEGVADTIDWDALARAGGTVVGFMALTSLDAVALRLLSAGRPDTTPVAVIARATLPGQRVLRTTLGACTLAVRRARLPMPALVVIGAVAALDLLSDQLTDISVASGFAHPAS
ncbi:Uroporphyrinogen-III C-methyltransferase [Rhodovastum atsumiense]|uniref:uroporphyrinogen-III C-methyltransferase n=1 Tax=Rhodovastum atsumiense TaxID=504468 RepID=A0A5M6ITP5_9PROT|nr:uroporphyrinogen-III C-methyltransferase [Rhodovastum atsumiense]KAA5611693.1 uroporphyrinogen-III C-methyltransferase [Rhodovastum atsumiense]CAH2604267.1 Uroporphyrinogen-III C-methyltransferase [Rhodovastum atsumiense]